MSAHLMLFAIPDSGMISGLMLAIARSAIEGGLLVLLVTLITRSFPRLPAATRAAMWWLVSLRLVAGLAVLPVVALQMPALPEAPGAFVRTTLAAAGHASAAGSALAPIVELAGSHERKGYERGFSWPDAARLARLVAKQAMPYSLALWACGVLLLIALQVRSARRLQRVWQTATPCDQSRMHEWVAGWLGDRHGQRVRIRVSDDIDSPLLMAGMPPRIVVPASCLALEPGSLRLVMAHEVAHIRRHDLALGTLPALAHALFWFHPLAHWAVEEYAQAREEACDADAVRACDASAHHYGELLLAYGIDRRRHLNSAASYGSRQASRLHRRLIMLAHGTRHNASQHLLGLAALIVIGLIALIPVRLVAANRESSTLSTLTTSHESGTSSIYSYKTRSNGEESFSFGYGKGVEGGKGHNLTLTGSFQDGDMNWIESMGRANPEGFGWFRLDRKDYVVREPAAVARIREVMAPQTELGQRQGELGERQGELGSKQGELGGRMGEIGGKQGELSGRIATLEGELASGRLSDVRRQDLRRRIAALQSRIDALESEQAELERKQEELSKQQDELSAQQDELSEQQDKASARAQIEMRKLAAEFIRTGQAVRVDRR